jgi:threonine dehydratase
VSARAETMTVAVERAAELIDPVFTNTPQYHAASLSAALDVRAVLKVETLSPIRSFKGRGASLLLADAARGRPIACASAGNFGQGVAYASRRDQTPVHVWASAGANPVKVARMRDLGAQVHLHDGDFDEAKDEGRRVAAEHGWTFVEDGLEPALAVGAATIASELDALDGADAVDAIIVPVGNGSLINGIGRWLRERRPTVRVIAVGAIGAPAMERAWRTGDPEPVAARTIADGIGARVPVPEAIAEMREVVDAFWLVDDDALIAAMRTLLGTEAILVEPAAAAVVAAAQAHADELRGATVALPLCGANVDMDKVRAWLS